jgi:hypothetical protein
MATATMAMGMFNSKMFILFFVGVSITPTFLLATI